MAHRAVLSADTSAAAEDAQVRRWREMTSEEKAGLIIGLFQAVETLALEGIRDRYPTASPRECFLRLAVLTLGRELACKADPEASHLPDIA